MPPMHASTSLGPTIASLATVITTTFTFATGAIVCLAVSFLLCRSLKRLRNRLIRGQYDEVYRDEKAKHQDLEIFQALETFALLTTILAYAIYILINPYNYVSWVLAISGSIVVTGVAIGLATTVGILMGLLKGLSCLTPSTSSSS